MRRNVRDRRDFDLFGVEVFHEEVEFVLEVEMALKQVKLILLSQRIDVVDLILGPIQTSMRLGDFCAGGFVCHATFSFALVSQFQATPSRI